MTENKFTSIQISKEVRDNLNKIKADKNLSYNKIIEDILYENGGAIVDDIITITREPIAFTLKYFETDNPSKVSVTDVSYKDLRRYPVGSVFMAMEDTADKNFVNSVAEIAYRDGDDVFVRVSEISVDENGLRDCLNSFVHVCLF